MGNIQGLPIELGVYWFKGSFLAKGGLFQYNGVCKVYPALHTVLLIGRSKEYNLQTFQGQWTPILEPN